MKLPSWIKTILALPFLALLWCGWLVDQVNDKLNGWEWESFRDWID